MVDCDRGVVRGTTPYKRVWEGMGCGGGDSRDGERGGLRRAILVLDRGEGEGDRARRWTKGRGDGAQRGGGEGLLAVGRKGEGGGVALGVEQCELGVPAGAINSTAVYYIFYLNTIISLGPMGPCILSNSTSCILYMVVFWLLLLLVYYGC